MTLAECVKFMTLSINADSPQSGSPQNKETTPPTADQSGNRALQGSLLLRGAFQSVIAMVWAGTPGIQPAGEDSGSRVGRCDHTIHRGFHSACVVWFNE